MISETFLLLTTWFEPDKELLSDFDFEGYLNARSQFSTDEWIDLLIQSMGFNPEMFGYRNKMLQLLRLVPYVERNFNLIELGPKGTGKSHIFSEFSPHGMLISGGEVTVPKLFVNNSSGKLGLVGYWDIVAFDEFAGKQKNVNKALVDILKNYLANKTFSRGVETIGAEASMAFIGNTKHNVPFMLKHSDFFEELPEKYYLTELRGNISLDIEITDLNSNKGMINVLISDESKNEIASATFIKVKGLKAEVSFDSIYPGKYAIQFYHDENQNGKLDMNLIGIPKESYGSSNDVKPVLGPPKFEKMLLNLTENKKVIMVPVN